jgi:hypothetical protein
MIDSEAEAKVTTNIPATSTTFSSLHPSAELE